MKRNAISELQKRLGSTKIILGKKAISQYFRNSPDEINLVLALPQTVEELQDIATFSYENEIPIFTVRRRYVEDPSIAKREGILVDLAKMNNIKKIDTKNLIAHIYGGVTFEQLRSELAKFNQRVLYPVTGLSPYVLRSYIDREILMGSGGYRHPHLSIFHAMLANGEIWISGSQQLTDEGHADFREDQGPQFSPFFGASEDIFGIPYYGLVYTYPNREERRILTFGFDELGPAKDLLYRVSHAEWCFEAFAANDRFLSVILSEGKSENVSSLRKKLKPWTVVFTLEHYRDLVELWERYIKEEAQEAGGKQIKGSVPELIEKALSNPWYLHERDFHKGITKHIFCYQYFKNVEETFGIIDENCQSAKIKPGELGKIVVPSYFGGAAYCEADIYSNPNDEKAESASEKARLSSFEALMDSKAFIDKPTGKVAKMLYGRTHPSYVEMIKLFKRTVDPKGLMNPDSLLEGV